jgi:hypothetical protein
MLTTALPTHTGLLLGSENFVAALEERLNRLLSPKVTRSPEKERGRE